MTALWLRIRAPFAAFRWQKTGVHRATSPVMPPSAARGLVLNLAHIDIHGDTGIAGGVHGTSPLLCIAVGQARSPGIAVLYQQLHAGPVRREILIDLDCVIGVRSPDAALLDRAVRGLHGQLDAPRYGLPFAGDNSLLIDRIDVLGTPCEACWYARVTPENAPPGSCRLTVAVDRDDGSKSTSDLFAPTALTAEPPESAWTWCPRAP